MTLCHRRSPLCGARTAPSPRVRAHRRPLARARDRRHERGVQRRLRRSDQSVSLRRRRSDDAARSEGQRRPLPVSGHDRRSVGPASTGANGRERRGRRRMEPDDDRRRYSRGRRRVVHLSERAESLGRSGAHGAMAHSGGRASGSGSRARRRARLPVLAAVLLGRSGSGRPHDPARSQELSDRRRDAAAVPLARGGHLHAAEGQVRPEHLLRRQPQDPARRLDGRSECRAAAHPAGVREAGPGALPGHVSSEPAQHHRAVRAADGAQALSAARRRDVAAARRLRQRVDPAARARGASPTGARRARGPRRRARPHRAAAVDGGAGDRRGRRGAGRVDRVEGTRADRRLDADQLVRRPNRSSR